MTGKTFAPWVEPIAARLQESRRHITELARAIPEEMWSRPSPDPGWTYKDQLAHLAVGDWVCQTVLRAAVAREPLDMALIADIDGGNARHREERAGRSIQELIEEVVAEGEETQELLARLADADEARRQEGAPMSLGEYLRMFPQHDEEHIRKLRTALES